MTQEIEKIWPEWKVVERIGSGAYGSVYKAVRSDHNLTSSAAIKVISIPKDIAKEEALAKGKEALGDKLTGNVIKEIYVPGKIINIVAK